MIIQVFLLDLWCLNWKVLTVVSFFWCERVSVTVKQNPIYYNSFVCFFRNTTGNGGGCNESTLQTGEGHVEVGMNHL